MTPLNSTLSLDVSALLDRERSIPPVSAALRSRALTRARAALVAGVAVPSLAGSLRLRSWPRAPVAAAACVASAALGAGAYELRSRFDPTSGSALTAPIADVAPTPARSEPPAPLLRESPAAAKDPTTAPTMAGGAESPSGASSPLSSASSGSNGAGAASLSMNAGAERRLLQQARAAVARQDYAGALPLLATHARLFKNGCLTEEREALRLKSLAGLGRAEEARHAAAAFKMRFPHSVLLPFVAEMTAPRN